MCIGITQKLLPLILISTTFASVDSICIAFGVVRVFVMMMGGDP